MSLEKSDVELKRINILVPMWLIDKVDLYAKTMNLSRTGAVCSIFNEYFKQVDTLGQLSELAALAKEKKND